MSFIDFEAVKADYPIDRVADLLGLQLRMKGQGWRGKCPVCASSGDRNLVVTIDKGVYYCFTAEAGGDQLSLSRMCVAAQSRKRRSGSPETVPEGTQSQRRMWTSPMRASNRWNTCKRSIRQWRQSASTLTWLRRSASALPRVAS